MSVAESREVSVLHVDDEAAFTDLVATFLEREDERLAVVTEQSAADGLAALDGGDIDCIVSDYQMPGTDGIEFLEAVREEHPDLPFILFTGKGSEEVASEAISAGVTDYLQKGGGTDQYTVLANRIQNAVARHRAEQQAERGFHALETAREGISLLDEAGYFTYVNDAFCEIVGYDREDLVGEHWELLYPEEDIEGVYEEILPSIPPEGRWTGQTTYVRADGERALVDHALSVCSEGSYICLITEMTATEGRANDGPLVAEDVFVEWLLDALADSFFVLDTEGNVLRANDRLVEVTGHDRVDLTSMHAGELFETANGTGIDQLVGETLDSERVVTELTIVTADGEHKSCEVRLRRLTDGEGRRLGVVGIAREHEDVVPTRLA